MTKPIFLIGYMACGKTTFGRALSRRLGRQFIDLDFYIEQRFHSTINDIFSTQGENGFRLMESNMLKEVGEFSDVIVACGGGTPCFHENMEFMLKHGMVVWLDASKERILERLLINSAKRPLVKNKTPEEISTLIEIALQERTPHYSRANLRYNSEYLEDRSQIDNSINNFLPLLPEEYL